ncbi:MAG: MCE family protein [Magnetococcales bacterium]|nr:MCE family protein [Magnetococcales bacterium]
MVDLEPGSPPPQVEAVAWRWPSPIWLVPLIAALIGGWIAYRTLADMGPQVVISFKTADGLEPGRTKVKYKDVEVGEVETVQLTPDLSRVLVTARFIRTAESHLTEGTRFWVVMPRLTAAGITGLNTLVSGAYIEVDPGPGNPKFAFEGLEVPPIVRHGTPGHRFVLQAERLGSLAPGSPVQYRGITVGEVQGYELAPDGQGVMIHAFVHAPHHTLVRQETRFWNASGIRATVDANGLDVRAASLQALLAGGVTFDTLEPPEATQPAPNGAIFRLHDDFESIGEAAYNRKIDYVLFFEGSVRGLKTGAPVEFRGLKIGQVIEIKMAYDPREGTIRIPVLVRIEPERITEIGADQKDPRQVIQTLVQRGLRARLETGSLLTGQLVVALDFHPDTPLRLAGTDGDSHPELPTIPASLEQITQSVGALVGKLQRLPLEELSRHLLQTAAGADTLVNGPDTAAAVRDLRDTLAALKELSRALERKGPPLVEQLHQTGSAAQTALDRAGQTLDNTSALLAPEATMHYTLVETLREVGAAAQAVRTLSTYLSQNPQALFFGRNPEPPR